MDRTVVQQHATVIVNLMKHLSKKLSVNLKTVLKMSCHLEPLFSKHFHFFLLDIITAQNKDS